MRGEIRRPRGDGDEWAYDGRGGDVGLGRFVESRRPSRSEDDNEDENDRLLSDRPRDCDA